MSRTRGWLRALSFLAWILGVVPVLATVLPFVPTDAWWIRILDFPRLQIAILAGLAAALALAILDRRRWPVRVLLVLLIVSALYQSAEVWRFTRLAPKEVSSVRSCPPASAVSLLIANVLMTNRNAAPLLSQIAALNPAMVLLTETDDWWDARLQSLASRYPHVVRHPRENTYGIHLYSKLELLESEVRFLVQPGIPSIRARVRLRSGSIVDFYGVHPTPPQPDRDTTARDVELVIVGRQVAADGRSSIVAGDLNDVGWSATTRIFKEVSRLLDPRVGRGLYATFNANWPFLQWPLDHIFVDRSFSLVRMERLGHIGSDHYPIFIEVCRQ